MAKVTNERLAKFVKLTKQIAKLNKEKGEIRKDIIASGSVSTREYIAEVETLKKEKLSGKEAFIEILGREFLEAKGLISTYTSTEVNVVAKGERLHNVKRELVTA